MLEGYSDRQKETKLKTLQPQFRETEKKQQQRTDEGRLRIAISGGAAPAAGI